MPLEKAIGQVIFKSLAGEGLAANAMIRIAKRGGGSYRRKEMLADIRVYTFRHKHEALIQKMDPRVKVPQKWMNEIDLKQDRRYRIWGKALYEDTKTGEMEWKDVSMYSNDHLDHIDYSEYYIENQPLSETKDLRSAIDFTLTGVDHNKTWTY